MKTTNKSLFTIALLSLILVGSGSAHGAVNDLCIDNLTESEKGLFVSSLVDASHYSKVTYNAAGEQTMRVYSNTGAISVYINDASKYSFSTTEPMKAGGGRWWVISDQRVKKNIKPYSEGLTALRKVQPRIFNYNGLLEFTPADGVDHIGVVAQELQRVLPEMVTEAPDSVDGVPLLVVDGSNFTLSLINAVKEQQQAIDRLRNKTQRLEALLCAKNSHHSLCKQ